MKTILNKLFEQQTLTEVEAYDILTRIGTGTINPSQIASFLTVYLMRNISVNELRGFQNALLDLCIKMDLSDFNAVDVCGTGGDGKNTFNISTLSAFVIAGAGYKVTKHGNYGVSSTCGSSNVLAYLGYEFTNKEAMLKRQLDDANFCMMHAPLFHPAMKSVGPIRQELGVKTFFNMLGPLVNPGRPKNQLVGVYSLEVARVYNYLLQDNDKQYTIVHSLDGYDEISLTGDFKALNNKGEQLLTPESIGFRTQKEQDIFGGSTISSAAQIFKNVLNNEATEQQQNAVLANSAFGIQCFEPNKSIEECTALAKESLVSGRALNTLKKVLA